LKTQKGRFLRLPRAYGDKADSACVAIALIWWKGRDSNPRPRHYEAPVAIGTTKHNCAQLTAAKLPQAFGGDTMTIPAPLARRRVILESAYPRRAGDLSRGQALDDRTVRTLRVGVAIGNLQSRFRSDGVVTTASP
jgi:hypothetical protein